MNIDSYIQGPTVQPGRLEIVPYFERFFINNDDYLDGWYFWDYDGYEHGPFSSYNEAYEIAQKYLTIE